MSFQPPAAATSLSGRSFLAVAYPLLNMCHRLHSGLWICASVKGSLSQEAERCRVTG